MARRSSKEEELQEEKHSPSRSNILIDKEIINL
jgi:hypothetical protein